MGFAGNVLKLSTEPFHPPDVDVVVSEHNVREFSVAFHESSPHAFGLWADSAEAPVEGRGSDEPGVASRHAEHGDGDTAVKDRVGFFGVVE